MIKKKKARVIWVPEDWKGNLDWYHCDTKSNAGGYRENVVKFVEETKRK